MTLNELITYFSAQAIMPSCGCSTQPIGAKNLKLSTSNNARVAISSINRAPTVQAAKDALGKAWLYVGRERVDISKMTAQQVEMFIISRISV